MQGPGIRFVEFIVPRGKAWAAGRFYEQMLGCDVAYSSAELTGGGAVAIVCMGPNVHVCMSEGPDGSGLTDEQAAFMQGVHIAIYISGFRRVFEEFERRELVWTNPRFVHLDTCGSWEEARACRQFRFRYVIDPENCEQVIELEHETRALRHFQYRKTVTYVPT